MPDDDINDPRLIIKPGETIDEWANRFFDIFDENGVLKKPN